MVFEQFLSLETAKKHPLYSFLLGFLYVIIGFFASRYFFYTDTSIATLFASTLLLVPSIYLILGVEEDIESRQGTRNFFKNHKDIFIIYLFLFLGVFFAYVTIAHSTNINTAFDYQLDFLKARGDLSSGLLTDMPAKDYKPGLMDFFSLISQNLMVVVICFILSIFYGAGALFLITLNASVFAAFISFVAQQVNNAGSVISLFLIHLIPELSGFLAAAIAGGVVSRALMKEQIGSERFKNVMKDAMILLFISLALIVVGAFLELYVTSGLVRRII